MEEIKPKTRTPSELLIECMESFGEDEPTEAIVIWATRGGDIAWSCCNPHLSVRIGMCEAVAFTSKMQIHEMHKPFTD